MKKEEFKYVRFLVGADRLTEENRHLIYGEFHDRVLGVERWTLEKEDAGYIFRNCKNYGTFGHWDTMRACVEKAVDFGLRVYMAEEIKFANPEE